MKKRRECDCEKYQQHKIICNKGYNAGYSKAENDYYAKTEKDRQSSYDCGYNAGYNKALNDFVKFVNTMPTVEEYDGIIRPMWLEEIAEQLKEMESVRYDRMQQINISGKQKY